ALDEHRVVREHRPHVQTLAAGERHDVGEVDLALGVLAVQATEPAAQRPGVEHVDRRVDLPDLELVGGGVRVLHDLQHVARALLPHDAAVPRRVVDLGREDGDGVAVAWWAASSSPSVAPSSSGTSPATTTTAPSSPSPTSSPSARPAAAD